MCEDKYIKGCEKLRCCGDGGAMVYINHMLEKRAALGLHGPVPLHLQSLDKGEFKKGSREAQWLADVEVADLGPELLEKGATGTPAA